MDYSVAQFEAMRLEIASLARSVADQAAEIERLRAQLAVADESARLQASVADEEIERLTKAWHAEMQTSAQFQRERDEARRAAAEVTRDFVDDQNAAAFLLSSYDWLQLELEVLAKATR